MCVTPSGGSSRRSSSRFAETVPSFEAPPPVPAPVQPSAVKPKPNRGFGRHGQPSAEERGPHQLGANTARKNHKKGTGKTERNRKPAGPPRPEKLTSKRGAAVLDDHELAAGALHWAEWFAAQPKAYTQWEMSTAMGLNYRTTRT